MKTSAEKKKHTTKLWFMKWFSHSTYWPINENSCSIEFYFLENSDGRWVWLLLLCISANIKNVLCLFAFGWNKILIPIGIKDVSIYIFFSSVCPTIINWARKLKTKYVRYFWMPQIENKENNVNQQWFGYFRRTKNFDPPNILTGFTLNIWLIASSCKHFLNLHIHHCCIISIDSNLIDIY